jgi:hypothetical protein
MAFGAPRTQTTNTSPEAAYRLEQRRSRRHRRARYEVDFWLRLRDGNGYSHGLTNPNASNQLYQAGPTAMAAWANAANAAILAEAYRIAGQTALMNTYRDAAIQFPSVLPGTSGSGSSR